LDRLASFNSKEAAKFIRRATADQGDALKWVLLVAEHSTFVGLEVIRRFSRAESLDFSSQPQLFVSDPSTGFELSDSGAPISQNSPSIFKVFKVLQEEKRTRAQQALNKSNEAVRTAPAALSMKHTSVTPPKDASSVASNNSKSRPTLKITEAKADIPRLKTTPAIATPAPISPSPSVESFLLPVATALNFKGCVSLTLSTLSIVLRHTPHLEDLCLDQCAYVTDDLWQLLKKQRQRGAIRLKRLSLAFCVCITDSFFTNMASADLLKELRALNITHCNLVTNLSLRALSQQCTKLEEAVRPLDRPFI
jgi:hypothetical protein